jgi:hypothetical protein
VRNLRRRTYSSSIEKIHLCEVGRTCSVVDHRVGEVSGTLSVGRFSTHMRVLIS